MKNFNFFRRVNAEECVARSSLFGFGIAWIIPIAVILAGYGINGTAFFTLNHWLQDHGVFYTPVLGIPLLTWCLCVLVFFTFDCLLGMPCYVGTHSNQLIIHRRKMIPFSDLDFQNMVLREPRVLIPRGSRANSPLILTALLADCSASELYERLAKLPRD